MSELIHTRTQASVRRQLLATVSLIALVALCGTEAVAGREADSPTVWLELGGQWDQIKSSQEQFAPAFVSSLSDHGLFSPSDIQKPLKSAFGGNGTITIEPKDSDWSFSASIRFGRSDGVRQKHQQTPDAKIPLNVSIAAFGGHKYGGSYFPSARNKFNDAHIEQSESHTILDFQAGKDVGLGIFGKSSSSVLSAGIRFAQFTSRETVSLHAMPDLQYPTAPITNKYELEAFRSAKINFHAYTGLANVRRDSHGIGPSLAWKGSEPIVGDQERGELEIDWGINGAVLFGRQTAHGSHHTTALTYQLRHWSRIQALNGCAGRDACEKPGRFYGPHDSGYNAIRQSNASNINRSQSVIIPNLGGFAGLSVLYPNAKVSFGYRADFFFGAMDGGIDARQTEDIAFHGPFATISVGLGG